MSKANGRISPGSVGMEAGFDEAVGIPRCLWSDDEIDCLPSRRATVALITEECQLAKDVDALQMASQQTGRVFTEGCFNQAG